MAHDPSTAHVPLTRVKALLVAALTHGRQRAEKNRNPRSLTRAALAGMLWLSVVQSATAHVDVVLEDRAYSDTRHPQPDRLGNKL